MTAAERAEWPAGTVTFLFTDLEGSTRLWEEHPVAMQPALARHDTLVGDAIAWHGGRVVKTMGDGFMAVFSTRAEALDAAHDGQAAIGAEEWAATGPLLIRMGVHTGEAQQRDGDQLRAHGEPRGAGDGGRARRPDRLHAGHRRRRR